MDNLEAELKQLIVTALKIEDLAPDDIDRDELLFGSEGLGLDSIDALELGVAIRKTYGITIGTISDEVREHFSTVAKLAVMIRTSRREAA